MNILWCIFFYFRFFYEIHYCSRNAAEKRNKIWKLLVFGLDQTQKYWRWIKHKLTTTPRKRQKIFQGSILRDIGISWKSKSASNVPTCTLGQGLSSSFLAGYRPKRMFTKLESAIFVCRGIDPAHLPRFVLEISCPTVFACLWGLPNETKSLWLRWS